MPTPQLLETQAQHNERLERDLAKRLHDLLAQAALFEQNISIETGFNEINSSFIAAEDFIKSIDEIIKVLDNGSFQLSKARILKAEFSGRSLLRSAIAYRFTSIIELLNTHGVFVKPSDAIEALNYNVFVQSYKAAEIKSSQSNENEKLLCLTLNRPPYTEEHEIKEQEAIAQYLIQDAKADLNFSKVPDNKNALYYAAVKTLSPNIVDLILSSNANDSRPDFNLLMDSLRQMTFQFQARVSRIILSLLNHLQLTPEELNQALLLATEMNCKEYCPAILERLREKGAVLPLEVLNTAIEFHIDSFLAKKDGVASYFKTKALLEAGGKVNADPAVGSRILKKVSTKQAVFWEGKFLRVDDLIINQTTQYTHDQLHEGLQGFIETIASVNVNKAEAYIFSLFIEAGINLDDEFVSKFTKIKKEKMPLLLLLSAFNVPTPSNLSALCEKKISLLSQDQKDSLLFKLINTRQKQGDHKDFHTAMVLALIKANANTNQRRRHHNGGYSEYTLLWRAVYDGSVSIVQAMLRSPLSQDILAEPGLFSYSRFRLTFYYYYPGYPQSSDLPMLALKSRSMEMIRAVTDAGFTISYTSLNVIKDFLDQNVSNEKHKEFIAFLQPAYALLKAHYEGYKIAKKVASKSKKSSNDETADSDLEVDLESKGAIASSPDGALEFLINQDHEQHSVETLSAVESYPAEKLSKMRASTLAMTLNWLFDVDLESPLIEGKASFNHAESFLSKLKQGEKNHVAVLADSENLPLRHLLEASAKEKDHDKRARLIVHAMMASKLLLELAPYTQLQQLQEDKQFSHLQKGLPAELKQLLQEETKTPRVDLLDYAFYIEERFSSKKNPNDKAKRCSSFIRIIEKLEEKKPDLSSLQKTLKDEIKKSTNFGKKGKAVKILEGIRRTVEEDASKGVSFESSKIGKFFAEHKVSISKVKEKIASKPPANGDNGRGNENSSWATDGMFII